MNLGGSFLLSTLLVKCTRILLSGCCFMLPQVHNKAKVFCNRQNNENCYIQDVNIADGYAMLGSLINVVGYESN